MSTMMYREAIASALAEEMRRDENVYFIGGEELTTLCKDSGTVDNCHPTDFGFASMAKAVGEILEKIILK